MNGISNEFRWYTVDDANTIHLQSLLRRWLEKASPELSADPSSPLTRCTKTGGTPPGRPCTRLARTVTTTTTTTTTATTPQGTQHNVRNQSARRTGQRVCINRREGGKAAIKNGA